MGKKLFFLVSLVVILIGATGCQKSSDSGSSSSSGGQQPPNQTDESDKPSNPGNSSPELIATNLVQEIQFESDANTVLTLNEAAELESEFLDCGVSQSLIPGCKDSTFLVSTNTISVYLPLPSTINGKVSRYKNTGKTLYLFRVDSVTANGKKTSQLDIFVSIKPTTIGLDTLAQQASTKLNALPPEEVISKIEATLDVKHVAFAKEFTFIDENDFASHYVNVSQTSSRSFYHWSGFALAKNYKSSAIVQFFRDRIKEELAGAPVNYKELFIEQGLTAGDFWKIKSQILEAFVAEHATSTEGSPLRGKLALSILMLSLVKDASIEHLSDGKKYLMSISEGVWVRRGVALFTKFGSKFGTSEELAKFGAHSDWSVRSEVAKALIQYADGTANQWLLRLNADTDSDVRKNAFTTISGRKFDAGAFNVSSLINQSDWSSRVGLAKALQYVTGAEADNALLRLAADTDSDVRSTALTSLQIRPFDIANRDISSLINRNDWSSRVGLAKALTYVTGQGANETLLRLCADTDSDVRAAALKSLRPFDADTFDVVSLINSNDWSSRVGLASALRLVTGERANQALLKLCADTDSDVRTKALSSLETKPFDMGQFNVSGLINRNDWSSRVGLAKALEHIKGQGANEALLRLNADTDSDVRSNALTSISVRPFDAGNFEVSSLINANDWSSRVGLAKALKYVTGQKSINALITLVSDSDSDVRSAAKESLKAHGY